MEYNYININKMNINIEKYMYINKNKYIWNILISFAQFTQINYKVQSITVIAYSPVEYISRECIFIYIIPVICDELFHKFIHRRERSACVQLHQLHVQVQGIHGARYSPP